MNEKPLSGQRIVITRAARQAQTMRAKLEALGARVDELPVIEIRPVPDLAPLDRAIQDLNQFAWIIFTSVNGVRVFEQRLRAASRSFTDISSRICAIGPATARAIERRGGEVHILPEEYRAEGLIEELTPLDLRGKKILLPRAASAREILPRELEAQGASVVVVPVYETVIPEGAAQQARRIFSSDTMPDWITFTSSSTVSHFLQAAGREAVEGVNVASIGPITSATARDLGVRVTVEAEEYTIDGLIGALAEACLQGVR